MTKQERRALKQKARGGGQGVLYFYSTDGYFGSFSNFSRDKITVDGVIYPTSEHYYQSQKYAGVNHERQIAVIKAFGPADAAFLTRDEKFPIREDWDAVKDAVMEVALRAKFMQKDWLTYVLVRTGKVELLEDTTNDIYWGIGTDGDGQNKLGRMLMQIRKELNAAGITLENCESMLEAAKPGVKEKEEAEFARCFKKGAERRKEIGDKTYKNPVEKLEDMKKNPTKYVTPLYPPYYAPAARTVVYGKGYGSFTGLYDNYKGNTKHKADYVAGPPAAVLTGKKFKDSTPGEQQAAYNAAFGPLKKNFESFEGVEGQALQETLRVLTAENQLDAMLEEERDSWHGGGADLDGEEYDRMNELPIPLEGETLESEGLYQHTFMTMSTGKELYCLSGTIKGKCLVEYYENGTSELLDEIDPPWFLKQNPEYAEQLVRQLTRYAEWIYDTLTGQLYG